METRFWFVGEGRQEVGVWETRRVNPEGNLGERHGAKEKWDRLGGGGCRGTGHLVR